MKRIAAILALFFVGVFAHSQTLSGVQVSPYGSVLQSGTEQFSVTCLYNNGTTDNCAGKTVTWSSSQPALASINSSGLATYLTNCGTGAYPEANNQWECWTHMVATVNGFSDYGTIFLQYPGDTLQLLITPSPFQNSQNNPIAATLAVGATATFGAGAGIDGAIASEGSANPFPGCNWSSSDTAVGTINRYGFFTALAPGTATVTCVLAGNGTYDTSQVTTYPVTVVAGGTGGNTWYVSPGGGTPYINSTLTPAGQCSGLVNAPYPGTGINQPCALGDFEYLYFDQVNNGRQVWMINGGDTVIVAPKATGYDTAIINAAAGTPVNCADFEYCDIPTIPSGTAAQPTRILGANYANCTGSYGPNPAMTTLLLGYGREALRATLSQYVDVECFEVADNSATNGYTDGLIQSAFTSYATFKNIFIHNAIYSGVLGASGLGITDDHLHIRAARQTGYNMDDFPYGISNISVAGGLTMTNSNIEFTGCKEIYGSTAEYPFVANECLDENTGGQGDGMGTGAMTGDWYYNNDIFRYNFQDGLDNLHAGAQSETILNSQAYGNDGDQYKFGDVGTGVFQNNFALGNCNRISEPFNGVTIAISGVNYCRAGGDTVIFEWAGTGSYLVQNNTLIGVGNPIIQYQCESTWVNCSTATTVLQNNLFAGYTDGDYGYNSGGQTYALYQSSSATVPANSGWVTRNNNDFYNVRSFTPQMAGDIAVDPLLANEPSFLTELTNSTESVLDNYNYTPTANSPVLGAGMYLVGLTIDAAGLTRPIPPAIGALEYAAGTTQPASQITLSATPNPVTVGQSITLSATIATANGIAPTGTVSFFSNNGSLGSAVVNSAGTATLVVSITAPGSDTLIATYSGDSNYVAGTSPALTLTVNPTPAAATTTLLQVSTNPIAAGQTTVLTATVAAGSGNGTPTGSVSFLNNGTLLGTATLNAAGAATLITPSTLAAGSHSLTAKYAGNANFDASTSAPLNLTVNAASAAATTTLLQVSSNPITSGQTTTLTATVAAGSGGIPSGSVSFLSNGTLLGTATLNAAGIVTLTTPSTLVAGTYSLTAKYAGNANFDASTSAPLNLTVNPAPAAATTTLLQVSASPITVGQTTILTATVAAGSGSGIPSGSISFLNNGTLLGIATLNAAGVATLTPPSASTAGSYSLTAKYAGNTNFNASTSAPLIVTVNPAPAAATTTLLQISANPITVGQTTVLTATVASSGSGTPTGSVSFLNNGTLLGTVALNSAGVANLTTSSTLAAGTYNLTAKYAGNNSFDASTSASLTMTINPTGVTPGIDVSANTPTLTIENGSTTSDAEVLTLTAVGGYSGTIQMACANLPAGSTCSFQPPSVTVSAATGPVTVVMTVQNPTTTTTASLMTQHLRGHNTTLAAIFWIPGVFAAALIGKKRKLLLHSRFLLLFLLLGGMAFGLTGCGASTALVIPSAQAKTTTFQVMAIGTGNVAQTINLNVTTQ